MAVLLAALFVPELTSDRPEIRCLGPRKAIARKSAHHSGSSRNWPMDFCAMVTGPTKGPTISVSCFASSTQLFLPLHIHQPSPSHPNDLKSDLSGMELHAS